MKDSYKKWICPLDFLKFRKDFLVRRVFGGMPPRQFGGTIWNSPRSDSVWINYVWGTFPVIGLAGITRELRGNISQNSVLLKQPLKTTLEIKK